MAKKATSASIRSAPPHYITSKYTDQVDGEALQFGVRKISVSALQRAMAESRTPAGDLDEIQLGRTMARFCVVDPPLTEEQWAILEEDIESFNDLATQISQYSLPKEAQRQEAAKTFRAGEPGPDQLA